MKKILSCLLASAMIAIPLSTSAFAQSRCGIKNALEKAGEIYNTYCENGSCDKQNLASVLSKLCGTKIVIPEIITGEKKNCSDGLCDNASEKQTGEKTALIDLSKLIGDIVGNNAAENVPKNDAAENAENAEKTEREEADVSISAEVDEVVRLVNENRRKAGLPGLSIDKTLCDAAQKRAVEQETLFSHTRPNGTRCFTALDEYGIKYRGAGENIAMGQRSAKEVMNDWMNSEGHRANILNGSFTKIGVGYYVGRNGKCYWSQEFIY